MTVKLRLTRRGKKKQPIYRVVAAEAHFPRDGRFIEIVGFYNPAIEPSEIRIDNEKALKWLRTGAQPSERVKKLLEVSGAWEEFTGVAPVLTLGKSKQEKRASKKAKEAEASAELEAPPVESKKETKEETKKEAPVESKEETKEVAPVETKEETKEEAPVETKAETASAELEAPPVESKEEAEAPAEEEAKDE